MCKCLCKEFLLKLNTQLKKKENIDIVSVAVDLEPLGNNDKLFITDLTSIKDSQSVSCQYWWMHNFVGFSEKYSNSVDVLYKAMITDNSCLNNLAYPLISLARHTLELRLKSIIYLETKKISKNHKLLDLWNNFSSNYKGSRVNFDVLLKLMKEFNKIDEFLDVFRYPVYKDNKTTKN